MQLEQRTHCPFCGEAITLLVDESAGPQCYTEDCPVCCRPMVVRTVFGDDGDFTGLHVEYENE